MAAGDNNVICDYSGFKVKYSKTRKMWNGYRVRLRDWEPRHPQDFLKAVRDDQSAPDPRPEPPEDYFLATNEVRAEDL